MILWRAGQGITGGVLIPTAITIVRSRLPAASSRSAWRMFGMVATFAPAIGPTIGGWLTENWSWHYIFYLNVIPGAAAVAIQLYALDKEQPKLEEFFKADWLGIAGMAIGLSSLIFVLEEGQREEWFDSHALSPADRGVHRHRGVSDRRAHDRQAVHQPAPVQNPAVGGSGILMAVFGATAFGSVYLIPSYLAQVQGYNAQQIGEVVMWSGIPQLFLLPLMPFLMQRIDLRLLVAVGLILFAVSCFINVDMSPDTAMDQLMLPQLLRAAGQPFATIPLTQLSVVGLTRRDTADFGRHHQRDAQSRRLDRHRHAVDRRADPRAGAFLDHRRGDEPQNSLRLQERLQSLGAMFAGHGVDSDTAQLQSAGLLAQQARQSATVMAYADSFWILGVCIVVSLATLLILRKPGPARRRR